MALSGSETEFLIPPSRDLADLVEVAPVRLGSGVLEQLTKAILEGRLKPGDALPSESRLATAFGVSKQVAREAIRELAAMGVIRIQQGKATRVRLLDAEPLGRFYRFAVRSTEWGLAEIIELRRILEPPITGLAAERWTPPELDELRLTARRMEASLGDVPAWIEADLDFHDQLAGLAHNRMLRLQVHGLRPVIREVMVLFNSREPRTDADWQATLERHARIVAAIEARDARGAQAAMSAHFAAADAAIAELFPDRPRTVR